MGRLENTREAIEERPVPSQAEGEPEPGEDPGPGRPIPSQAEGELETVEEDLRRKS
jgi:hypothetical protein